MTTVSRSAVVPYSAMAMFELVDDVSAYPDFLPWVKRATEHYRDDAEVRATLLFSKGGFEKDFTTLNRRHPGEMIDISLVEGPFRQLEGIWRFQAMDDGSSRVSLDLEFEFSSRLLAMAFGRVFTQVATSLVDSFVRRARAVYS